MTSPLIIVDLGGAAPSTHLAVDLLEVNYQAKLETHFHCEDLLPRVAYKCEENGNYRLQLPAEVYRVEALNALVLTIRSVILEDRADSLISKIADWVQQMGSQDVIVLSSELDYSSQFVDPYSGTGGLAILSTDSNLEASVSQKSEMISISENFKTTPPQEFLGALGEKLYERLKGEVRLVHLICFSLNSAVIVGAGVALFKEILVVIGVLGSKGEVEHVESLLKKMSLSEGSQGLKIPQNWKLLGLHK